MIVEVDRNIYSDSCISKTIYWLSGVYDCERQYSNGIESIKITPKERESKESVDDIKSVFLQTLHDYKLRDIIKEETKDINTILYLKAFADCDELLDD
jgi:His-Xaa-Ser system protein HxsD